MINDVHLCVSEDFWKSIRKLPIAIQGKVMSLWNRMRMDPWDKTFHPEKVKSARDDHIWSAQVDDNYRLIWALIKVRNKPDMIVFLYVDKHEPAYQKARQLKLELKDGMPRIIDLIETIPVVPQAIPIEIHQIHRELETGRLFIDYSDQKLLDCGVPDEMLPEVRSLDTEDELDRLQERLPEDVYNNLIALVLNYPELVRVPDAQLHHSLEKYHGGDNLHLFVDSEEFKRALEGEWEDWMLFLAPRQRKLVYTDFAGPARVKGVVGSGKTVVAVHRALHLAQTIGNEGPILFLTYGNRLPGVLSYLLRRLAGENAPKIQKIECRTIHQWCLAMLRQNGVNISVGNDAQFDDAIQTGIAQARKLYPGLKLWNLNIGFFRDEIRYAIKGRAIQNFAEYAALERSGRGTALSEIERKAMWEVYQGYQNYLASNGLSDFEDYILKMLDLIENRRVSLRYRAAVVDEIQDLNVATMRLIRAIVPPAPNDLFLVGDGLQKLYPGGYVLSSLGIDVVGRGTILRRNYRNTQEILRAAYAMVENTRFSDLDESDAIAEEPEYSPRHGPLPIIKHGFSSPEQEIDWVAGEIARLKEQGLKDRDFAILYRWRNPYESLIKQKFSSIISEVTRDPETYFGPLMKMTTFDSAKGLEFKVVFVVGVTDAWMVPKDDFSLEGPALEDYLARERSRLFVAMTRARDLLYLSYARGQLSRFLQKVPSSYFENV